MSHQGAKRLAKELQQLHFTGGDKESYKVVTEGSNILKQEIILYGQMNTPYHNGKFRISYTASEMYPFKPPKVKFITPIWHPNISSTSGEICLDVLKDKWSAQFTIHTTMISLLALLSSMYIIFSLSI